MLNGINNYLSGQISQNGEVSSVVTNPFNNPYQSANKGLLIDESAISNVAVKMYQHDLDVRQFTQLSMSNPEDLSHNELVGGLFDEGVVDPLTDEAVGELANNDRLWADLGL